VVNAELWRVFYHPATENCIGAHLSVSRFGPFCDIYGLNPSTVFSSDAYEVAAVELEVTGRTLMVHSTSEKTLAVCSLPPRGIQSFVGTNFFRTPR
jgi:hypothetical protein